MSELICRVNRATRTLLIKTHPLLWATAIALGALPTAANFRVIWPVGLMAAIGTILDKAQERDGHDRDNRDRMTSETAELVLQAVLATRRSQQQADQFPRLVAAARPQSAPEPPRHSAG